MSKGEVIADKYEVLKELGRGSYGRVYLVQHRDLGVKYALKLLNRNLSDDANFIQRFKQEAEILLRFTHPGITQLRDFGRTEDNLYYMATDFCSGRVLEDLIREEGWFPVIKGLEFMLQVLDVLEAAHAMEIVHRDIKPGNVMIETDSDGRQLVRVLDFGIAKLSAEVVQAGSSTAKGVAIGTPEYMSPEQASGKDAIDHLSDIYSSGVLMYELVTGAVPFKGQSVVQTLLKHLTQPPPPFAESLGIPPFIEEIVMRALQKEPVDRFQDASDFRAACLDALARIRREGFGGSQHSVSIDLDALSQEAQEGESAEEETKKTKILCLDDNDMILQIVSHVFEREGYEVHTASSFAAIHDIIFGMGVRLMLCDVAMPGLSGPKICQMLKETNPELRVILFSNIDDKELEKLSQDCHADAWVSKNDKPKDWLERVREVENK